jgi:glycosyltransferase involved in cell wall biosynthesis
MIQHLQNKIEICHVTSAHPRYDVRIFHKECKSLASYGFSVTLLVNDKLPNECINHINVVSTQEFHINRYNRIIKSKKAIKKLMLKINADVYHFHDPELLPEAAWIKKKRKIVFFDFHEDVSQQILFKKWIPYYLRNIASFIYKKYESFIAKKFDALITVTPKFVERLKKINPNTVMITNFPIINNDIHVYNKKKKAICFAGGITPQWNHHNIIKAIENIDGIEYILAGSGPQEYIDKLKTLQGWDKVRYLGRIPHEKVKEIYCESMVGMTLLSNNTQVGNEGTLGNTKIFEFMEAGLPIICSNNKIWADIVNENKCGYAINPSNINEIQEALSKIIDIPELSSTMGNNGREAVRIHYNWNTQEKIIIELYKNSIDKNMRAR